MAGFGGAVKLTGESEYRKALSQITQNLKVVSAEMKATTSSFDAGEKSEEELAKASQELSSSLETQKKAIADLKSQLATMTKEYEDAQRLHQSFVNEYDKEKAKLEEIGNTLGTTSKEYEEQKNVVTQLGQVVAESSKSLDAQGKALNDMKVKTANAETTVNKTAQALNGLGKEAEESGKEAEKGSEGFTVMKGVLSNLATQVINSVIDGFKNMGKAVVDTVAEVGALGDEIDKESQKLGLATDTYQELAYAMEMSGASIGDISKGMMNITNAIADTENGVEGASEKFDALGVSLQNVDGSMKSSEQVLMESIDALASMTDETQRNALANDIFGRSYADLKPLLNSGSEGIKELMQEAEEYGMVMSQDGVNASADFDDSLTRLNGTIGGIKKSMVGNLLPSVTTVINGFSDLANGSQGASAMIKVGIYQMIDEIKTMIPEMLSFVQTMSDTIIEIAPTVISALVDGIMTTIPQLIPTVVSVLDAIVQMVVDNIPHLLVGGIRIITGLADGIAGAIPNLISQIPTLISNIVEVITDYLPDLVQSGLSLITALADGIMEAIPNLIAQVPTIITSLVNTLLDNIPMIIETGISLLTSLVTNMDAIITAIVDALPTLITGLVDGLLEHLPEIIDAGVSLLVALVSNMDDILAGVVGAIPDILDAMVSALLEGVDAMADVGLQLIQGLWNGISDATDWLIDKIGEFTDDVLDAICDFFGIASPSKVMRDTVGKNLALGIGVGFENEMKTVSKQMQDAMPTSFDVATNLNTTTSTERQEMDMVSAFKEALSQMKIEMDDEEMGKFVDKTVTELVYA
jgi:phage-related protein